MTWVEDLQLCGEVCAKCSHKGRSDCRIMFLAYAWEQLCERSGGRLGRRSVGVRALRQILAAGPDLFGLREVRLSDMPPWRCGPKGGDGRVSRAIRRLEAAGFVSVIRSPRIGETNLYRVLEPSFRSIFGVEYAGMSGDVAVFLGSDIRSDYASAGAEHE